MKHAATLFGRYKGCLTSADGLPNGAPAASYSALPQAGGLGAPVAGAVDTLRAHIILSAVFAVWASNKGITVTVIEMLTTTGIVSPSQVVSFLLQPTAHIDRYGHPFLAHYTPSDAPAALSRRSFHRSLRMYNWHLVHSTLQNAYGRAQRDACDLGLFRGGKVYDTKEEEMDADVATDKERSLINACLGSRRALCDACVEAVASGVALTREVQSLARTGASGLPVDALLESLRVCLANLRSLASWCIPILAETTHLPTHLIPPSHAEEEEAAASGAGVAAIASAAASTGDASQVEGATYNGIGALLSAVEASVSVFAAGNASGAGLLPFADATSSTSLSKSTGSEEGDGKGAADSAMTGASASGSASASAAAADASVQRLLHDDLAGAVVYASLRWDHRSLRLPSPLLRDRDVPQPAPMHTWHM